IPEVVHRDGTARVQVVERDLHPRYYALLERLEALTGNAVVLNTSLNRQGEPIACSPRDAAVMFLGSDLRYLVLEDLLVTKRCRDRARCRCVRTTIRRSSICVAITLRRSKWPASTSTPCSSAPLAPLVGMAQRISASNAARAR